MGIGQVFAKVFAHGSDQAARTVAQDGGKALDQAVTDNATGSIVKDTLIRSTDPGIAQIKPIAQDLQNRLNTDLPVKGLFASSRVWKKYNLIQSYQPYADQIRAIPVSDTRYKSILDTWSRDNASGKILADQGAAQGDAGVNEQGLNQQLGALQTYVKSVLAL